MLQLLSDSGRRGVRAEEQFGNAVRGYRAVV